MDKRKVILWMLPIMWMTVIFYFSHQTAEESAELSGRVLEVIADIIKIKPTPPDKHTIEAHGFIRSMAHFFLYFVLGVLLYISIYTTVRNIRKTSCLTIITGVCYGIFDEIHQLFVDGRAFQITDIIIDSVGVLVSLILSILITKILKKHQVSLLPIRTSF